MGIPLKRKIIKAFYKSSIVKGEGETTEDFNERKKAAAERFASEPTDVVKKRLAAKNKVPRNLGETDDSPGKENWATEEADAELGVEPEELNIADSMMTWTPENITNTLKGMQVAPLLRGTQFLMEIGEAHKGWHMDFRGSKAEVSRYPIRKIRSKKPPKSSSTDIPELQSLPWIWYKNRRFFTNLETGKISLKSGIIRKKIAVSDVESIELLGTMWNAAKEKSAQERSK